MPDSDTVPKKSRNPNLTGGSRKGIPNKTTKALKEMILEALDGVGGVTYLMGQATENPNAFMALVGKALPLDAKVEHDGGITIAIRRFSGN